VWGAVADLLGISGTLVVAAAGLAAASAFTLRWRLAMGTVDRAPSQHWAHPVVVGEVAPEQGPVMVMVEYQVDPAQSAAFAAVLERLGHVRRRDGALFWEHFTDTADPTRHIETFIAESWIEHLRQHERVTLADRALEEELRAYQMGDEAPVVTHLVSARTRASLRRSAR
jgi:quinol monooxygenase YgiN